MSGAGDRELERFTLGERLVHWGVALAFVYAALGGLSLWSTKLFWLATVLGGGTLTRQGHPWGGLLFAAVLTLMLLRWARPMRLDRDDRRWLRGAHRYAMHEGGLPEAGRFNAGQKALFWSQLLAAAALLVSGLVLWFPLTAPRGWTYAALLVHPVAAVASMVGIVVHVYMATAAVPGSLRAMTRGRVSAAWAAAHHPKWFRQVDDR